MNNTKTDDGLVQKLDDAINKRLTDFVDYNMADFYRLSLFAELVTGDDNPSHLPDADELKRILRDREWSPSELKAVSVVLGYGLEDAMLDAINADLDGQVDAAIAAKYPPIQVSR